MLTTTTTLRRAERSLYEVSVVTTKVPRIVCLVFNIVAYSLQVAVWSVTIPATVNKDSYLLWNGTMFACEMIVAAGFFFAMRIRFCYVEAVKMLPSQRSSMSPKTAEMGAVTLLCVLCMVARAAVLFVLYYLPQQDVGNLTNTIAFILPYYGIGELVPTICLLMATSSNNTLIARCCNRNRRPGDAGVVARGARKDGQDTEARIDERARLVEPAPAITISRDDWVVGPGTSPLTSGLLAGKYAGDSSASSSTLASSYVHTIVSP